MTLKIIAAASCCLLTLLTGASLAQAPAPREVPDGFVLPGPPPTNAPPAAPAAPTPGTVAAPAPATPPTVSGAMVVAPQSVLPSAGTTQLLGSAGKHLWPCVQRKVDTVSPGQVWSGPSLDDTTGVERSLAMRQLVEAVSARRLPLAEAEKASVEFVEALPEENRPAVATALFADLLKRMNAERSDIMRGIERYGARQQALAEKLREQNAALSDIRAKGDAAKTAEAQEALLWDTRVFDERRRSLTYVCEVPTLIEQRLFGLGRAMKGAL